MLIILHHTECIACVAYLCTVEYFVFVISVCVLATVLTVVVLHLYLRAETHPVTPMPTWVGMELQTVRISTTALKIIILSLINWCSEYTPF